MFWGGSTAYFRLEKQSLYIGLIFFAVAVYVLDIKYYISFIPFAGQFSSLVNTIGLLVFLLYLTIFWSTARKLYQNIFGGQYTWFEFVVLNIRTNLPIFLPWLLLSLFSDLFAQLPFPELQKILTSQWDDIASFFFSLLLISVLLPPLVQSVWGCTSLPEGFLKTELLQFCSSQHFSAKLLVWPLFEGRMLTAAVMGIVPSLRYVLLTPAIMETMTVEELKAVLAHEIGHVKHFHLLLYFLLLGGFSLLAGIIGQPVIYMLLSSKMLSDVIIATDFSPESILAAVGSIPLLCVMLLFFRYVFGFFMRNFERQADFHVLKIFGNSAAIVATFEKISSLSGQAKDLPNWHHFGIGERIRALESAEAHPEEINQHHNKVRLSLMAYVLCLALGIGGAQVLPTEHLINQYRENVSEAVLLRKARQEPNKAIWHQLLGDLMLDRKMEEKAESAYQKALQMEPSNPDIMNNYAWLLLTCDDLSLRDPQKALELAERAAFLQPTGYIYDTLATALWANGRKEEAILAERQAIQIDPQRRKQYQTQLERIRAKSYQEVFLKEN